MIGDDDWGVALTFANEKFHTDHPLIGRENRISDVGIAVGQSLERSHGAFKVVAFKVDAAKPAGAFARNESQGGLNGRGMALRASLARRGARDIWMCAALHEAIAAAHEVRGDEHIFHTR